MKHITVQTIPNIDHVLKSFKKKLYNNNTSFDQLEEDFWKPYPYGVYAWYRYNQHYTFCPHREQLFVKVGTKFLQKLAKQYDQTPKKSILYKLKNSFYRIDAALTKKASIQFQKQSIIKNGLKKYTRLFSNKLQKNKNKTS